MFVLYITAVLPDRYNLESHHHIISRSHFFPHNGFSEGESILQVSLNIKSYFEIILVVQS